MGLARAFRSVPRWLVVILGVLLALGHACELPTLAAAVSHAAEDDHHHGDEALITCDAVGVPSSAGSVHADGAALGPAEILAAVVPVPSRPGRASAAVAERVRSRPPLFLLHASLLI
jgi:hypothetical protein